MIVSGIGHDSGTEIDKNFAPDFCQPSEPAGHRSLGVATSDVDDLDIRFCASVEAGANRPVTDENSIAHTATHTPNTEEVKKAGISRSTYFRAKRNLKSHGGVRSAPSGKQIGRPQKLNAAAEKLIQDELARNPAAELKRLQSLVLNQCAIQVSLSSISRRLKVLGCSPSQNAGQTKQATKLSDDRHTASTSPDDRSSEPLSLQHEMSEFEQLPDLDNYEAMHRAFSTGADLTVYENSPGMGLDLLEMHPSYSDLDDTLGTQDDSQLYKYGTYEKSHDLHDYSPGLNQSVYQHAEHQRQMLFNDPSLGMSGGWQSV